MPQQSPPSADEAARAISDELAHIHGGSYDRAPQRITTVVDDDVVVSVIYFELSPLEETGIARGCSDAVRELRHGIELSLEPAFRAAVERATGRTVVAFVSETHLHPDLVCEQFTLASPAS